MVGLALAIRASPNAGVGEEAAPPEFTAFDPPCTPPACSPHVCGLVRRQEIADISVALWRKYSAPHAGVRNAKRFAYLWSGGDSADAGIEYISPERLL
jgi:hypothetical protein